MSAPRFKYFTDHRAAMADMETFRRWGISTSLTGDPPHYVVTIESWPFEPGVRLVTPYDPQPLEDDFQESRQWDDGGAAGLGGYRRRPSLNDAD